MLDYCWLINNASRCFVYEPYSTNLLGLEGGVQDILAALRGNLENSAISQACCGALWSLAVNGLVA